VEADAHLMAAIAEEPRLMPHLHLSLQSGDDMILKRMKRRHCRADAIRFCEEARRLRPDMVFGADLIAGFPTETDAMFANSLRLIDDCGLSFLHVFPFSSRTGTPAARMPQLPRSSIKERAARLREKAEAAQAAYLQAQVGRDVDLLMERGELGRTPGYAEVRLDAPAVPGELLAARVTRSDGALLYGQRLQPTLAS
jgi:threonylcarbamoyladenosine tRNA methylthiotransferase MtaB